ncbi:MAG TPA: hypothetical protein VLI05_02370 [Candidatus Saccharimonadia bacterium]|nr:hypothetical protein [Candidatus Saccharimonadia bacterium]
MAAFDFGENDLLAAQRIVVVAAIRSGSLAEVRAAWRAYQVLAEASIEALTDEGGAHAHARIGLILAKAAIWQEAGDQVRYWEELMSAQDYAEGMAFDTPGACSVLDQASAMNSAEYLQAAGRYEAAIEAYIGREQLPLTDHDRGLLNYRVAECYQALLPLKPNQPEVADLLNASIQSALLYLEERPEQGWALRLLDEVKLAGR